MERRPHTEGLRLFSEGFTLRDYQTRAVQAAFDYLARPDLGRAPVLTLPAGAGKSLVCAELVREAVRRDPDAAVLVLTHRPDLIHRNAEHLNKFARLPCATYAEGLKSKSLGRITLAMMGSFVELPEEHYPPDVRLVIVPEAHLVQPHRNREHQKVLARLAARAAPGHFAMVGLTATPFHADGSGYLWEPRHDGNGNGFDGEAYRVSVTELVAQDFLVPQVTHEAAAPERIALNRVRRSAYRNGTYEYNLTDQEKDLEARIAHIAATMKRAGKLRRKWMAFTPTETTARALGGALRRLGVPSAIAPDELPKNKRNDLYERFRDPAQSSPRALVEHGVLATGFEAPATDLVALVRATANPVLYAQIVGRALRPHPGKTDALVLDFGGNVLRHGPVDDLVVERRDKNDVRPRVCSDCGKHNAPYTQRCEGCGRGLVEGTQGSLRPRPAVEADTANRRSPRTRDGTPRRTTAKGLYRSRQDEPDGVFDVEDVKLRRVKGACGKPDWLEMVYRGTNGERAREGLWPDHSDASRATWLRRRREAGPDAKAANVDECLSEWDQWDLPIRVGYQKTRYGHEVCQWEYAGGTARKRSWPARTNGRKTRDDGRNPGRRAPWIGDDTRKPEPGDPDLSFEIESARLRRKKGRDGKPDWLQMEYRGTAGELAYEGFWPENSEKSHWVWLRRRREMGPNAKAASVNECLAEWGAWRLPKQVVCHPTEYGTWEVYQRKYPDGSVRTRL